jgi:hypothetical protein
MARTFALLGGLAAMSSLLLLTPAQPLSAAKRPSVVEKELLGIRILQSYRTVLAKYGQPTRIYRGGESVLMIGAQDANGNLTGGVTGLEDGTSSGGGMGGGRGGMPGGKGGGMPGMQGGGMPGMMPGGAGRGGMMPGGMMPGGMAGGPPGMMPGGKGGGIPGMQGGGMPGMMPGGMSGGPPGMMPGGMGGRPGSTGNGLGTTTTQGDTETFGEAGGFQWVYFYPKQELVYWFVFNRDGRVEAILERGRYLGQKTSQGIGLGSPVKSVYTTYGWPDTIEQQGTNLALRYNVKHHVQVNILNNKVTAVGVFLSETQRYFSDENAGGGAGGGGRGMGGPGGLAGGGRRGGLPGLSAPGGGKGD